MSHFRNSLLSLVLNATVLAANTAHAEMPPDIGDSRNLSARDPVVAQALFKDAVLLIKVSKATNDTSKRDAACEKFNRSYALSPTAIAALRLAGCREEQGKLATAFTYYQWASNIAHARGDSGIEQAANRHIKLVASGVSYLTIHVEQPVPGLRVDRDNIEATPAEFDVALPIDPGDHVIAASAPGFEPAKFEAAFSMVGEKKTITVPALTPTPTPTAPPIAPPVEPSHFPVATGSAKLLPVAHAPVQSREAPKNHSTAWLVGGVGATALLIGSVSGILAMHDNKTVDNRCGNTSPCADRTALEIQTRRNFENTVAWVTIPVGLAAVATATTWLMIDRARPKRTEPNPTDVGASVDAHGGQLTLSRRF